MTPLGIILTIVASCVGLTSINKFLEYGVVLPPKRYRLEKAWKWRDAIGGVLNALVSGTLATIR